MKMTIEEAIHAMEYYDKCHIITQRQARAKAVGVMQKYQKIEEVLSDWINDDSVGMSDYWMGRIKEVIEDGKID